MISTQDLADLDRVLKLYMRIGGSGNGYSCGNWQIDRENISTLIFSVYYKDACVASYFRDRDDDTDKGCLDISGDEYGFNDEDSKKIADHICSNFGLKFDYSDMIINGKINGVNAKWLAEQKIKDMGMTVGEEFCENNDELEYLTDEEIKEWLEECDDEEMKKWLKDELERRVLENDDIGKGE